MINLLRINITHNQAIMRVINNFNS